MGSIHDETLEESGPFSEFLRERFQDPHHTGISSEFLEFICGARLGDGMWREAFFSSPDPSYVIKCEMVSHTFKNSTEMALWTQASDDPELNKWLAPVKAISGCGRFMLMKRTAPVA